MVAMVYYTLTTKQRSNGMKDTILDCLAFVGAVALVVVVVGMCECPVDCGDSSNGILHITPSGAKGIDFRSNAIHAKGGMV